MIINPKIISSPNRNLEFCIAKLDGLMSLIFLQKLSFIVVALAAGWQA